MAVCSECRGEGCVPEGRSNFVKFLWNTILLAVMGFLAFAAHGIGKNEGVQAHCPVPPEVKCPTCSCPEPKCLTQLPHNCGRVGDEKVVCTRNDEDRLRIGVESRQRGPYDPVFFYTTAELVEKMQEHKSSEEKNKVDGGL